MFNLTGYYHEFISAYVDPFRPLTQLTHKTSFFIWTN